MQNKKKYHIDLEFQPVRLPPVRDILILCHKFPQGKHGVMEAFKFIAPDEFEMFDVSSEINDIVEAVLINKKILKKISFQVMLELLQKHVFPYISQGEAINVDIDMKISTSVMWNQED